MLLATLPIIKGLPNEYESSGLIIVSNVSLDPLVVSAQIASASQQLTSQTQLDQIIRKYPVLQAGMNQNLAIQVLRKSIKFDTKYRGYFPDGPESFTIAYRHPDPKVAQQIVAELTELFNRSNENAHRQALQEMESVNNGLAALESQLQEFVAAERQKSQSEANPKSVLDTAAVNSQRLATSAAIESLTDKQFGLEQQIASLKQQITDQKKLVKQSAVSATTKSAEGSLLLRKAELQGKLNSYSTQYTEKHPKVIEARNELAEVNRQLANLRPAEDAVETASVNSLEAQALRTNERELTRLETEKEITRRELERKKQFLEQLPPVSPDSAFIRKETTPEKVPPARDIGALTYSSLSEQQRTLLNRRDGLQKILSGNGVFQILDRPEVSQTPVGPNRKLLAFVGLALGLALGLLAAFLIEVPRLFRIRNEQDVEYFLGAPVLALIPETLTPAESNRKQRLQMARNLLFFMVLSGSTPLFYLLIKLSGIFEILKNR